MQIFIEQLKQIGFRTETYFSVACVRACERTQKNYKNQIKTQLEQRGLVQVSEALL